MKKPFFLLFVILILLPCSAFCQKFIQIEDLWSGIFMPERMEALSSMKDGKRYTVLSRAEHTGIEIYDYVTQQKVKTLLSSKEFPVIKGFSSYDFSPDEQKILIEVAPEPIYRYSKRSLQYVFDIKSNTLNLLSEDKVQEPAFSPDGTKVAFVYRNNIFIKDILSMETYQITYDGKKSSIINGITDWVYEEEFTFVRAYQWSPNGNYLAFLKFDETEVPTFSMDVFNLDLYPSQYSFKYPKAGEKNSKVSLFIYDIQSKTDKNRFG